MAIKLGHILKKIQRKIKIQHIKQGVFANENSVKEKQFGNIYYGVKNRPKNKIKKGYDI